MKTANKTYKFIGKVLPDGHLSIPNEVTKDTCKVFEVTMKPIDDIKKAISLYLERHFDKKGKMKDIKLDLENIENAVKKAFGTLDVDAIINAVRK